MKNKAQVPEKTASRLRGKKRIIS